MADPLIDPEHSLCEDIINGLYDAELARLKQAVDDREAKRKADVLEQVKEIFGPGAQVTIKRDGPTPIENGIQWR